VRNQAMKEVLLWLAVTCGMFYAMASAAIGLIVQ
jgi:hypothetical protein